MKQHAIVLLNDILTHLERILYGIFYLEEITPRTGDLVQSFGERLSVILVSAMLQDMGVTPSPSIQMISALSLMAFSEMLL